MKTLSARKSTTAIALLTLCTCLLFSHPAQSQQRDDSQGREVWKELMEGNERFMNDKSMRPNQDMSRVRATQKGQNPKVIVVTCSDSRVTPEIVFDQGLGDVFLISIAGNLVSNYGMGSIEYAAQNLGSKCIVVLGHTDCGVISAYLKGGKAPAHINDLVKAVQKEPEVKMVKKSGEKKLTPYITAHVKHVAKMIDANEKNLAAHGMTSQANIYVVPALYDISTGKITVIEN